LILRNSVIKKSGLYGRSSIPFKFRDRHHRNDPLARHASKKESPQKEQPKHEDEGKNYHFDKAHKSSILKRPKRDSIPAMQSMSKYFRPFVLTTAAAVLILQLFNKSVAQDLNVQLQIRPESPVLHVEGQFLNARVPQSPLAFLSDYAGIPLPEKRVFNVKQTESSWSYDVLLPQPANGAAFVHVSWLLGDRGVLRLADLLPAGSRSAHVKINASHIFTTEKRITPDLFGVERIDGAVFYLGFDERSSVDEAQHSITLLTTEKAEADTLDILQTLGLAQDVYGEYLRVFRSGPSHPVIAVLESPEKTSAWYADTRGNSITILSSASVFESQSAQQLHEQLRHEMFHLWIPNGVHLTGNYDWFYEGFALYQSLKLGVALNRLRFEDYLDTLSRANDADRRLGGRMSLIDASKNRWSSDNNTVVYARGMLVAFLCDMALLNGSKGKQSTDDLVREVYRRHSGDAAERDGKEAVTSLMREHRELVPVIDKYVSGTQPLVWDDLIKAAGLQSETKSGVTTLSVVAKPSGSQKRMLDKLGYNNWRKLISK
jgi:hypothetical protein